MPKTKNAPAKIEKKAKTKAVIILDRSSSMSTTREQAVEGYNQQVAAIKEAAAEQDIETCLLTFTGEVFEHFWLVDADKLESSTYESYVPNGCTALYDAMGYAIQKLQQSVKDDEDTAYLVIVISDGEENSSRHFDSEKIRSLVEECKTNNRWTFTYMGCSESSLQQFSKATGINIENMAVWNNTNVASAQIGTAANRASMSNYFDARKKGVSMVNHFYSQDSGKCADYSDVEAVKCSLNLNDAGVNNLLRSANLNVASAASASPVQGVSGVFAMGNKVEWTNTPQQS